MNRILLILTLFFTTKMVHATECVTRTFQYKYIDFELCQNYSNYNETTTLLYKARAKQLNNFIADLVAKGLLKDKKFIVEMYDRALTYNYIFVSQSKNNYNLDCSGFLSFNELTQIIFYFTQKEWKSFTYDPAAVADQQLTRQKFLDIINKFPLPDVSSYTTDSTPLFQLDNISLRYRSDTICYASDGEALPYQPTSNLPVKIHDRYLFFQADSIFVVHNNATILTFKIPEIISEDYTVDAYSKWVNIGNGGTDALYSYSYDNNKFFDLTQKSIP